jgi:signal transduction histidine kinase
VIGRLRAFLFSFQTKLVLAMTGVIVIALFLAGAVFVARDRSDSQDRALERVAASSPVVYEETLKAIRRGDSESVFHANLDAIATDQDVRILVVSSENTVIHDTGRDLIGSVLEIPEYHGDKVGQGFYSWKGGDLDADDSNLVFVAAAPSRFGDPFDGVRVAESGDVEAFRIVLAVQSDTIADAWLGVLPSLWLAGLVAIPIALIAAMLLARQVSNPVRRLTAASEALALGNFDQRVAVGRDDEVGRLSRAFTSMAERVGERDQQMRALLANVSHDLKTPLTSITGYAQALADGTAGPGDVPHIGRVISEEAEHINRLLEDLLYLGEIDAGQIITRREDVPLDEVVGRCARRIDPVAASRRIEVAVDVEPGLVVHNADPDKLERAVTNILENAAKFTPDEGTITVVARREPAGVTCAVTNSGSAIPDEDLPRIFDRFFRGDRARRASAGSGLGLSIARELVELSGGRIAARNEPGGAVTFTVAFAS